MDGFVQGPEAVRTVVACIRTLYDYQKFNFAGPYGDNGWLEDYTAGVRGEPINNVTVVTRNAAGQARHIVERSAAKADHDESDPDLALWACQMPGLTCVRLAEARWRPQRSVRLLLENQGASWQTEWLTAHT
jgi:hypothetical protein